MITITNFLTIDRLCSSDSESEELTFNVYSVTIYPKKGEIRISDDVCPDENPSVTFPLADFYSLVKNFVVPEWDKTVIYSVSEIHKPSADRFTWKSGSFGRPYPTGGCGGERRAMEFRSGRSASVSGLAADLGGR
jgi:hypothetical protein